MDTQTRFVVEFKKDDRHEKTDRKWSEFSNFISLASAIDTYDYVTDVFPMYIIQLSKKIITTEEVVLYKHFPEES